MMLCSSPESSKPYIETPWTSSLNIGRSSVVIENHTPMSTVELKPLLPLFCPLEGKLAWWLGKSKIWAILSPGEMADTPLGEETMILFLWTPYYFQNTEVHKEKPFIQTWLYSVLYPHTTLPSVPCLFTKCLFHIFLMLTEIQIL